MNIETKDLLPKIKSVVERLQKYTVFISIILVVIIYGFIVYTIGAIASVEPNEDLVQEKLQNTKRLRIDQESIDKIERLQDQNVRVKSLFKDARDNPFREN